ncbi:hypothetical protein D3C84_440130 [compost metagenome]
MAPGGHAIGRGKLRIELGGLVEQRQRLLDGFPGSAVQFRRSAQVIVVGVQAFRGFALGALDFRPFELRRDRADDAFGDLILQFEDVVEHSFEAFRPDMRAGRRVYELPGDAHLVAGFAHATFQHVAHAELLADFLDVHRPALVGEARIARDDEQPADTRQGGDDVLHHAVGEIFLLRIAAQVLEGQDGDGGLVRKDERGWRRFLRLNGRVFADAWPVRLSRFADLVDLDFADEAVTLTGDCAHQTLLLAGVADGLAHRVDVAGNGRFRDDPAAPHCLEQVVLADHVIAVADQLQQQVEDLRPDGHDLPAQGQFPALLVEHVVFKHELQGQYPLVGRPRLRVRAGD